MCSYGFLPEIIQPTRVVVNQSPSLTDNIFNNNINDEITSGNIFLTFSEYFSQIVSVKREKWTIIIIRLTCQFHLKWVARGRTISHKNIYIRDYSKFSSESFRDDISIQNWNNKYDNINNQFNDFHWRLDECMNRHAPIKKLSLGEIKLKSKPWITDKIKKMIKFRNKLFACKKRQPNNSNVTELFNKFRNRINREIIKSKKSYFTNYFKDCSSNMKKHGKESDRLST